MSATLIDGRATAAGMRQRTAAGVAGLAATGWSPRLVSISVGSAGFDNCREVAGRITPVPRGGGPVTVAVPMRNAVLATDLQMEHYSAAFAAAE